MPRRAPSCRFDSEALFHALSHHARLKDLKWDFEMSRYNKPKRSQAPDRQGLITYYTLLSTILSYSPSGFPNFTSLKDVILQLNAKYRVRSPDVLASKSDACWAEDCANSMRVALKHVVDLKRSRTQFLVPALMRPMFMRSALRGPDQKPEIREACRMLRKHAPWNPKAQRLARARSKIRDS